MRKFYLCGMLILLASLSWGKAPFGLFDEERQEDYQTKQLWAHIINGRPITLDLELPASQEANRNKWERDISNAFNRWFTDTARNIEQSGKAGDFADVMPILRRGLKFGSNGFVIHVVVQDSLDDIRQESRSWVSMALTDLNTQTMYLPTQEVADRDMASARLPSTPLWIITAHEFGHMLGFIGQYPRENARHMDQVGPRSYSSKTHPMETVMSEARPSRKIGCDDTDAIINMIDQQRGGAKGARAGKIWESFCSDSQDGFRDGEKVGKESYQIRYDSRTTEWQINTGNGTKKYSMNRTLMGEKKDWAFVNPQDVVSAEEIDVVKRDKENRPIKTKTNNGATVYYEYFQEVTRKAAFMGSKLAWVETVYQDRSYVHELEFLTPDYRPITLKWSKPATISYKEGRAAIELSCRKNAKGQLACDTRKDELARQECLFGDFRKVTPSSTEYQISQASAVRTLTAWFEQLPDGPSVR